MKRGPLILMLLLAPIALSGVASAGVIRGAVRVPPVQRAARTPPQPYPGRASGLAEPRVPVLGAPEDAVIYIASLPAEVNSMLPDPGRRADLAQERQSFTPRVVAVTVGGRVAFPNRDPIYHNVFSVSPVKRFDLGRYARGKSKQATFERPGVVNVYCDIHSNMEGFIVVVPNRAVARPDTTGRFSLPDLPPGRYNLVAWHPDSAPVRREVVVPDSGDVEVELSFQP